MGCSCKHWLIAGAVLGALLAVLGGILIPVGDSVIRDTVRKETVIEPGTTAYEIWSSAGVPVYRQFWLFDVQNPLEVVENGSTPVVVERGPYTYKTRYLPKENITVHRNGTVAFLLPAGAVFVPSMSIGQEEDRITALNLGIPAAHALFPEKTHKLLNFLISINNASLFQSRTVKEMLWGYYDPVTMRTVGVFYPYNGTFDGYYNVHTGKEDISKVGVIDRWKGERELPYWKDNYCDMINGTDASSFAPFLDKKKELFFFTSDICRSVSAEFTDTVDLKGIEMYRYMLPPLTLAAPTVNPANKCYCHNENTTRNCSVAGVLDTSSCREGVPIYISLPHFLYGSEILRENVLGLDPSETYHNTFLDVEPTTGFTMRFAKRIQINMMYTSSNVIKVLNKVKEHTIFPLVWLNETAELDDETADMFKAEMLSPITMLETVQVTLLSLGSVVFVVCSIAAYIVHRKSKKGQDLSS
ncbi:platelet glycoprotein 4 [Paramormyrops kingsleyae]|uniref:platelet glycoprotein 4 n=1 Tax=Paramormyrops kingsleyae TaxID=1676925 RepID=UPI003B96D97F